MSNQEGPLQPIDVPGEAIQLASASGLPQHQIESLARVGLSEFFPERLANLNSALVARTDRERQQESLHGVSFSLMPGRVDPHVEVTEHRYSPVGVKVDANTNKTAVLRAWDRGHSDDIATVRLSTLRALAEAYPSDKTVMFKVEPRGGVDGPTFNGPMADFNPTIDDLKQGVWGVTLDPEEFLAELVDISVGFEDETLLPGSRVKTTTESLWIPLDYPRRYNPGWRREEKDGEFPYPIFTVKEFMAKGPTSQIEQVLALFGTLASDGIIK